MIFPFLTNIIFLEFLAFLHPWEKAKSEKIAKFSILLSVAANRLSETSGFTKIQPTVDELIGGKENVKNDPFWHVS